MSSLHQDKGYAWIILASSFTLHLLSGPVFTTFGIYLVEFVEFYSINKIYIGILGGFQSAISILAPLLSPFVQKYGCRVVCFVGGILMSCGYILSSFSPNFEALFLSFGLLAGLGFMTTLLVAGVAPQQWFNSKRALASGVSRCGYSAAYFFWPPLTRYLIDAYSWKGSLLIIGGILLNIIVCAALVRKFPQRKTNDVERKDVVSVEETPSIKNSVNVVAQTDINSGGAPQGVTFSGASQRIFFAKKVVEYTGCTKQTVLCDTLFSVGCLLAMLGHISLIAMVPLRAKGLGISKTNASILYVIYGVVSISFRVAFGFLGDAPFVNRILLTVVGISLTGALNIISVYLQSFLGQCVYISLFGITAAQYYGAWPATFADVFGTHRIEFAMGVLLWCGAVGYMVSLPVAGLNFEEFNFSNYSWLVDLTDDPNTPFLVFGTVMIVASVVILAVYFLKKYQTVSELK